MKYHGGGEGFNDTVYKNNACKFCDFALNIFINNNIQLFVIWF